MCKDHSTVADFLMLQKTLPGLGGRSLVDGGLADGGGTLAHEIGHALVSIAT